MKVELKTWGAIGLATALAGAGLAGCAGEAGEGGEGGEAAQVGEAGEGEGGEGGEGEGGVSAGEAASDPVAYLSALAVAEAHVLAARDAMAVGQTDAAAEMFAHPVSEVLLELDPVFADRGVGDFKELFSGASTAVLEGEDQSQIEARVDAIIAALRGAAEKAPEGDASAAILAASVSADQIERAASMYGQAAEIGRYEPYLDGYGFYKAAEAAFDGSSDAIKAENADLHAKIAAALSVLAEAYPNADEQREFDYDPGALQGASSAVMLALG